MSHNDSQLITEQEETYYSENTDNDVSLKKQAEQEEKSDLISQDKKEKLEKIKAYLEKKYGKVDKHIHVQWLLHKLQDSSDQQKQFSNLDELFYHFTSQSKIQNIINKIDKEKQHTYSFLKKVILPEIENNNNYKKQKQIKEEIQELCKHFQYDNKDFKQQLKVRHKALYNSAKESYKMKQLQPRELVINIKQNESSDKQFNSNYNNLLNLCEKKQTEQSYHIKMQKESLYEQNQVSVMNINQKKAHSTIDTDNSNDIKNNQNLPQKTNQLTKLITNERIPSNNSIQRFSERNNSSDLNQKASEQKQQIIKKNEYKEKLNLVLKSMKAIRNKLQDDYNKISQKYEDVCKNYKDKDSELLKELKLAQLSFDEALHQYQQQGKSHYKQFPSFQQPSPYLSNHIPYIPQLQIQQNSQSYQPI
ncbi:hypothetical protein ABPG72_004677 [Tetrahymena utriculariae]